QMSNGIGGLIDVTRRKPIYFDLEPTAAADPGPALAAAGLLVADWGRRNPALGPPGVVPFARGATGGVGPDSAMGQLTPPAAPGPAPVIYHLVATEAPHRSLAYPASNADIDEPNLAQLWSLTSPLMGRQQLSAERPTIHPEARGMVINGKFDLILAGLKHALV